MQGESGILLGFDVGLKRTGVAVGQSVTGTAEPAGLLNSKNGQLDWQEVDQLITKWQPTKVVIGEPGSDNPHLRKLLNRLVHHLQSQHGLPIHRQDEAFTTEAANSLLAERGVGSHDRTELRDQLAACLILEAFMQAQ